MKIYKDKDGTVTIVFSKNESTSVNLVHDRGAGINGTTNMFGYKLGRYVSHCANAHGDSGYSTMTEKIEWLKEEGSVEYKLVRKPKKS
jgi:hypothetical protein